MQSKIALMVKDYRLKVSITQKLRGAAVLDASLLSDLNRTVRGHSIVSRPQSELISLHPFYTGLNLNKCLVQDLFLYRLRNQVGTAANTHKDSLPGKNENNYFFFVLGDFSLLTTGGLISVRFIYTAFLVRWVK